MIPFEFMGKLFCSWN